MPYEIALDLLPIGYSLSSAKSGEEAPIKVMEFTSSEDGSLFISRLDGFPATIVALLPPKGYYRASNIDHLLAIIRKDKTATVYVNELEITGKFQSKRKIDKGQAVYSEDIADIEKIIFNNVRIPEDAGVLFIFSIGWRKGLFFDFSPLHPKERSIREYDLEKLLGQYYAYLFFQDLFKILENDWHNLIEQQWFPFITLKRNTIIEMINHIKSGWLVDELLEKISGELNSNFNTMLEKWQKSKFFGPHVKILQQAVERYKEKDYISVTSILYPRIEGIMRTYHQAVGRDEKVSQENLITSIINTRLSNWHPYSYLLPDKFQHYLQNVYFASFDPKAPKILSRHTVAHGVAPVEEYSLKGATIGFLILEQLSYYLGLARQGADNL